jgi:hypothetical protein
MNFDKLELKKESNVLNLDEVRTCNECNEQKTVRNFNRRKRPSGEWYIDKRCTKCHYKKYKKSYSERNKERYKDEEFRERKKEYSKRYRQENPELIMFQSARSRSKSNNIEFNLDISDVVIPDKCPILEIPFCLTNGDYRKDDSPTLDRIDPKKGYTKGNVRVISYKANVMKNDATLDTMKTFCKNILSYMQVDDIV